MKILEQRGLELAKSLGLKSDKNGLYATEHGNKTAIGVYLTARGIIRKGDPLLYAANCALWLLSQPELENLIQGEWADPSEIKELLENAGCVASCDPLK